MTIYSKRFQQIYSKYNFNNRPKWMRDILFETIVKYGNHKLILQENYKQLIKRN